MANRHRPSTSIAQCAKTGAFWCTGYRQSRYASGSGYLALAAQGGKSSIRLRSAAISPALREGSIRVAFGRIAHRAMRTIVAQSACAVRISSHHCPIARAAHSRRPAIASIPKKYRQSIYCVCFDLNALRRIIGMRFAAINATVMMRMTIDESALIDGLMRFDIV